MSLRYKDKVTIITGATQGIGEGCLRVFVQNGAKVVFCAKFENEGDELEKELNAKGPGECYYVQCDVTKEEDIKNLIGKTLEKYGRIDCLLNNAGTHPPHKSIDDFSTDDFKDLLNLNLVSYFTASKYALPHLRKTKGNIINMASMVGHLGQAGAVTYVATKGAISAMTRALSVDEAAHDVRVNAVSPSSVLTPLYEKMAKLTDDPEACIQAGKDTALLGRMGTLEEIGQTCLFLAAEATFCTGIDIPFSGGSELNYGMKNMKK